jgi:hypothetical protein
MMTNNPNSDLRRLRFSEISAIVGRMAQSEYRQALVTFIDILGFSEMVKGSEQEPANVPKIRDVIETLRKQLGSWLFRSKVNAIPG